MAADAIGNCMYTNSDAVGGGWNKYDITHADCTKACNDFDAEETRKGSCNWIPKSATGLFPDASKSTVINEGDPLECSWWTNPINCPLVGILQLEGHLLGMSGTLFTTINKVENFKAVVDGKAVYSAWKTVRDFLNIAFILVLLYSAFCTILQIEKYSYKKLLLTLVIMALLVNFSFPIARFIIDVSNTLMYTIINSLQYGSKTTDSVDTAFGLLSNNSGIATILKSDVNSQTSFLLAAVIFVFIFAITLLAIGVMLLIRMIALAILIIFSPLAFVATILPDAGGYSSKWWDNLFKYSFFGPIMMFMIYIATQMMAEMSPGLQAKFITTAQSQSTMPNLVGTMAYFSIPIVILWLGMGMAASMSGAAGSAVMGGAQKFIGKVGKFVGKAPFKGAWWGMKKTGIPGGVQQKWKSVTDKWDASQKSKEARVAARLGVTGATVKDAETRAADYEKNHESDASLIIKTEAGDAGAALALVKRGKMDDKIYGNFVSNNKDASLKEHVAKKVKKNRVDILIKYGQSPDKILEARQKIATESGRALATITDDMAKARLADNEMKKLSPEDIKSQYWGAILDGATPDIERAAKKMFAGIAPEAREEIAKGQSSSNRESVNKLRNGGFI